MDDGDVDLGVGGVLTHRSPGHALLFGLFEIESAVFEELGEAPGGVGGFVVGVFHGLVGTATHGFEFTLVDVVECGDEFVGEFDEWGLLFGGFVVAREALDDGQVGADGEGFWAFDAFEGLSSGCPSRE